MTVFDSLEQAHYRQQKQSPRISQQPTGTWSDIPMKRSFRWLDKRRWLDSCKKVGTNAEWLPLYRSETCAAVCSQGTRGNTKGAHFERFLQINVRMDAQLSQGVSNKVVPADMKDQEGASGQQRLQGEKHEDILQVGSVDCHLEQNNQSILSIVHGLESLWTRDGWLSFNFLLFFKTLTFSLLTFTGHINLSNMDATRLDEIAYESYDQIN